MFTRLIMGTIIVSLAVHPEGEEVQYQDKEIKTDKLIKEHEVYNKKILAADNYL